MSLSSIRSRVEAATPGPWGWTGNQKIRWIELSTLHSGRLGVMRFERWGMTGAQPVFLDPESRALGMGAVTNVKASDVPIFEVCRDATSADDPRVYRADIIGLRHPDAAFIAHARQDIPALLRVAEAADEARAGLGSVMWVANNAHNHKLDDFRLLLESALEDWRKGYDALVAALDELEALP